MNETTYLHISTKSLKNLLRLFEESALLENLVLSDTQHPFSGFIDESIFGKNPSVQQLLRFNYEFTGLVHFKARIGTLQVEMQHTGKPNTVFKISGSEKKLEQLGNLAMELNVYSPGRYRIS